MVIINTSATDVSIHAVSPELGVHFSRILPPQAGGAASCASAMSPNARQRSVVPKRAATNDTSLWRAYVPGSIVFPPRRTRCRLRLTAPLRRSLQCECERLARLAQQRSCRRRPLRLSPRFVSPQRPCPPEQQRSQDQSCPAAES